MKKVMVFGTFDIFHYGHLNFLKQAKKLGDVLIVVIAKDVNVLKIKNHKPFHNENERKSILSNIKLVNKTILGNEKDVYLVIKRNKPDFIALGYDQEVFVDNLNDYLKKNNLKSKVVRLKPFKKGRLKCSLIKKYDSK